MISNYPRCCTPVLLLIFWCGLSTAQPWQRHTIDGTLKGADGVRLADFNGDGLQDVVTGWEESGVVRLYVNPGPNRATDPWPAVTVGLGKSPEDAVAFDVDGDGQLDVVSCHEGKQQQILVHRCTQPNASSQHVLEKDSWQTQSFSQANGQQWMFATPLKLRREVALVAGSKGKNASITLLIRPAKAAEPLSKWKVVRIRSAGWIMSLYVIDMDGDGDQDVVFSDRKGGKRGVAWLEQPDTDVSNEWIEHPVGGSEGEPLFIDASRDRILVASRNATWTDFRRSKDGSWNSEVHSNPTDIPHGKAIRRLATDQLVMTSNTASDKLQSLRPGIWFKQGQQAWHPIGSETRVKFARIECIDWDGDGDLDVMTCEERRNLGVVWYENPAVKVTD